LVTCILQMIRKRATNKAVGARNQYLGHRQCDLCQTVRFT
jgi:hypothetical protein